MNFNRQDYVFVVGKTARTKEETTELVAKVNKLIEDVKNDTKETYVTITTYNATVSKEFFCVPVAEFETLTNGIFSSRAKKSCFAQAMLETMADLGKAFSDMKEEERSANIVVFTEADAADNVSDAETLDLFAEAKTTQELIYSWHFATL